MQLRAEGCAAQVTEAGTREVSGSGDAVHLVGYNIAVTHNIRYFKHKTSMLSIFKIQLWRAVLEKNQPYTERTEKI